MSETQPALATTKRKFHKLVDSIAANASTTSLASSLQHSNASTSSLSQGDSPEHPSKRPRSSEASMERDRSISASQARIQALKDQLYTPRRQGTVRVVGKAMASSPSAPRKTPNFQPHSQEQFLSRVKTFADVKKWTTKPDAISEIEWAKRGWSCDTWNTVACKGGCEKRVAVKLYPKRKDADGKAIEMSEDFAAEVDDKLVERYRELIETGHAADCSFQSIAADVPLLENVIYPEPSIKDIVQRMPSNLFGSATPPSSPSDMVAFAFALFGWSGLSESRISLAVCDHCFQRLGLWLSSDTRLKEMSKKLDVPIESLRLNLLESHREHCPWKNATTQSNSSDGPIANMAAWKTLQFILLGKQKELPALPCQELGHSRNMESVDLGSEAEYPRGSLDSHRDDKDKEEGTESLQGKWQKFKAKLRRTTSKKSLKSVKSMRSAKSGKSTGTSAEK
ncbi:hypothetical protein SNOG_06414 [Parastagonospora nodorum SN15]|uniref:C3HC-type domain-containing protein n=1 Tax=Phaeosphaeria nodorum (strain SN15 / ATCC MYA-4574 / FGSC 10173) TaxID=321614 RepID=Q0UPA0_PHANO|nr:hypothetical protein SNOG_06414 [Parastagonospora nodorum SN15]EAT86245.2 hypothetical protein SNOG_06414 [Parastagonospora nodorum SN15]